MESPAKNSRTCPVFFLNQLVVVFIPLGWLLKLWETVTNLSCLENCVLHNRRHANLQRKFSIIFSVGIFIDKTSISCPVRGGGGVHSVNLWERVCRWDTEILHQDQLIFQISNQHSYPVPV